MSNLTRKFNGEEKEKVLNRYKTMFARHMVDEKMCDEDKANVVSKFNNLLDENTTKDECTLETLLQEFNKFKKAFRSFLINFGKPIDVDQIIYYERVSALLSYEF